MKNLELPIKALQILLVMYFNTPKDELLNYVTGPIQKEKIR